MVLNKFKMILLQSVFAMSCLWLFVNCSNSERSNLGGGKFNTSTCYDHFGANAEWGSEVEVEIDGYSASAMEPKIAADQGVLFFNDKPAAGDSNMNIHYAVKQNNGRYLYIGTLPGTVDANDLDGVPAIDSAARFYFVSTRTYGTNFQMIYSGQTQVLAPNSLAINGVAAADNAVTLGQAGTVDMDIDVSWDGAFMIASRAQFSGNAYPDESQLVLFNINTNNREALVNVNSASWLANVNYSKCVVYAGNFSPDLKELYFSFFPKGSSDLDAFRVAVSKRNTVNEPFGPPEIISGISGRLTEAPSVTFDDGGKTLFYHRFDQSAGRFKIYKVSRP